MKETDTENTDHTERSPCSSVFSVSHFELEAI